MENNTAPFEVGDEVVCVDDKVADQGTASFDITRHIKRGDIYVVYAIERLPCGCWGVDIGVRGQNVPDGWVKCSCNQIFWESGDLIWYLASRFRRRPIESYKSAISEILEKYPISEGIETDVEVKELQN